MSNKSFDDFTNYSISCILGNKINQKENGLDLSAKSFESLEKTHSFNLFEGNEMKIIENDILASSHISSLITQTFYPMSLIRDTQSLIHLTCLHHQRAKRKRTKVTDGRDDKGCFSNDLEESQNSPAMKLWLWNCMINELVSNQFTTHTSIHQHPFRKSIYNSNNKILINKTVRNNLSIPDCNIGQQFKVLGPNHLRKAKLMFFYTRYPSSSFLKSQFPDIKFEKSNTAQLVKWFSNFREFYYIQIEKFARQTLNDGKSFIDLDLLIHEDLYRILVMHYNRNNQILVPKEFATVVKTTLEEFYLAIANGKDKEQSWKKVIYKKIARLDQDTPSFFKDPYWITKTNNIR